MYNLDPSLYRRLDTSAPVHNNLCITIPPSIRTHLRKSYPLRQHPLLNLTESFPFKGIVTFLHRRTLCFNQVVFLIRSLVVVVSVICSRSPRCQTARFNLPSSQPREQARDTSSPFPSRYNLQTEKVLPNDHRDQNAVFLTDNLLHILVPNIHTLEPVFST